MNHSNKCLTNRSIKLRVLNLDVHETPFTSLAKEIGIKSEDIIAATSGYYEEDIDGYAWKVVITPTEFIESKEVDGVWCLITEYMITNFYSDNECLYPIFEVI